MPDDSIIVSIGADVSGLTSGLGVAKSAINDTVSAAAQMAQKFMQSGLSAKDASDALIGQGYSAKEASAAMLELGVATQSVTEQTIAATSSMSGFERAAAMAGGRVLGMEAGLGMAGGALGRVASYLPGLGEAFAIAFPVAIIALLADKVYHVYENVVLLKSSIDALNKSSEEEATKAASLNYEYDLSAARLAEQNKQFSEARALYEKAASEKPLELPKIDDKVFKQFNSEFVTFLQAVHTSADAPTVITHMQAEADATAKQIAALKEHIAALSSPVENAGAGAGPIGAFIAGETSQAKLTDLTQKLQFLQTAIGTIQSQAGLAGNALSEQLDSVDKASDKADSSALKLQESLEKMNVHADHDSQEAAQKELRTLEESERAAEELALQETEFYNAQIKKQNEDETKGLIEREKAGEVFAAARKEDAEKAALADVELRRGQIQQQASHGEIGPGQEVTQLEALNQRKHAIETAYLADRYGAAIAAAKTGETLDAQQLKEYSDYLSKKAEADKAYNTQRTTLELSQLERIRASEQAAYSQISGDVNRNLVEVINGSERAGRAMQKVWTDTADAVISALLRTAEQMIVNAALQKSVQDSTKLSDAATAARNTYASASAIPVVGWALAPVAAAAAFAAVLAFEKGGLVPGGRGEAVPILAHAGEAVLPQHLTSFIQTAAANQSGRGNAGHSINVNYSPTIHAIDTRGVSDMLREHGEKFTDHLVDQLRKRNAA